jgi:membrane fusion protein (multidrug efflux system)
MSKRIVFSKDAKTSALTVCVVLAACAQGHAVEEPMAPEAAAIQVESVAVAEHPMPRELPLTGQIVAQLQSDVAANGVGRVLKTFVERGSYVKAGDPLAQLDTSTAAISVAQAKANLASATAAQELANTLCKRNQELLDRGAISKEEWERTANQCKASAAGTEAAKAQVTMASKSILDSTVRAPFAGMVGERYVSAGEYVQPPSRVVNLVELDPLRLQMTVPEPDIGRVHQGQEVNFDVEAFPGQTFVGTVKYIDPTVRTSSRDLLVEALVHNPDHTLKPGMFAVAHLKLPDEKLPAVPASALVTEGAVTHLYAVVSKHVEERIVQRGPERDGFVAILDGIKAGENVVTKVSDAVKDGVPVK